MPVNQAERIRKTFTARFGREPMLVRSPGRINLIGEHTDYNEGFVLPAAVDCAVIFAIAPRDGRQARLLAADLGEECAVSLDRLVAIAWTDPAVLGARMMGGGFGGCTVNLVRADGVAAFAERVRRTYRPPDGGPAKVYACRIEGGTRVIARPPVL